MTKTLSLLVAAIALGLSTGNSLAAVSAEQASALNNQLTPLGAEKAGNAAGSIPAWGGGLTKAPAGYVRATTPTRVTVTPGLTSTNNVIAVVANVQQTPGTLPVLGSNGMTVAMIGGSALLVGGLLFALFGRRRKAGAEEVSA